MTGEKYINLEPTLRLVIGDAQPIFCCGLVDVFKESPGFEIVGQASDGQGAIRLALEHEPDIALIDLQMRKVDGLEVIGTISSVRPSVKVVALGCSREVRDLVAAIRAGAKGYILKTDEVGQMVSAVIKVGGGDVYISQGFPPKTVESLKKQMRDGIEDAAKLDEKELEVLRLVAAGVSSRDAKGRLHISDYAFRTHLKSIRAKLHARNRAQAVAVAASRGLIELHP